MNNYKILCEIGEESISFNIGGKPTLAKIADLENEEYLNRIYRIQFRKPPKGEYLDHAIEAIKKRPDIALRFYGDYSENLIRWDKLTEIKNLQIDLWHIENLKNISNLTNLKSLGISKNISSKVSLSILEPLTNLEILYTSISKDIEAIRNLDKLKILTLREIKNNDLDFLTPLKNLETLYLSLGSFQDFNGLSSINNLNKLDIHQVRGFDNEVAATVLINCKMVEALKLENLKHLTSLDFIKKMIKLKYLSFEGVKNLNTYKPILENKSLETIAGYQCQPLDKSLSGLKHLKNVFLGDSYSKSAINDFLKISEAINIQIKRALLKGTDRIKNPFLH